MLATIFGLTCKFVNKDSAIKPVVIFMELCSLEWGSGESIILATRSFLRSYVGLEARRCKDNPHAK